MPPSVLIIAGSDSSAGAGIQADLKTCAALGVYATTAITAVTAQNTQAVTAAEEVSPALVEAQIDAVCSDLRVAAVKSGMLSSAALIEAVARGLRRHPATHYVLDGFIWKRRTNTSLAALLGSDDALDVETSRAEA